MLFFRQRQRFMRAQHHQSGIPSIGFQRGGRNHRRGYKLVRDRRTRGGINNVRKAFAIQFVIIAIAAGRADTHALQIDNRLHGRFFIRWLLNRYLPRIALRIMSAGHHSTAHRHQIITDAIAFNQPRQMVRGVTLADR